MKKLIIYSVALAAVAFGQPAAARVADHGHHVYRQHHHRHHHVARHYRHGRHYVRYADGRPRAWCGWYMRKLLGVADPALNLARNWARWGAPAGGPRVGAVVVWPHHVGKIVGQQNGQWVIESGNDGHAVRTRPRSIAGAIAFRVPG